MKTTLAIEQSQKLMALGIDPKLASEEYISSDDPLFTLTDLLSILPKEIKIHRDGDTLSMIYHCGQWRVGYTNCAEYCNHTKVAPELIDALYQLLIYVLDNNLNQQKK